MRPRPGKTGIYAVRHRQSGACYIGATRRSFEQRWEAHRSALVIGVHHNAQLQHAWQEYGPEAFEFVVLESISAAEIEPSREQHWIDSLTAAGIDCYNRVHATIGPPLRLEHRQRLQLVLTAEALLRLTQLADARGLSKSAVIETLIRQEDRHGTDQTSQQQHQRGASRSRTGTGLE